MDVEFRGRRNPHLVQKGNFMEVNIELWSEGWGNEVVLGSSPNSFYLWKQFMSHVTQQTNVTPAVLVNLAGNGNLLTPGRKFMMGEDAIEFYEQNSAMRTKGKRMVVPGTMWLYWNPSWTPLFWCKCTSWGGGSGPPTPQNTFWFIIALRPFKKQTTE